MLSVLFGSPGAETDEAAQAVEHRSAASHPIVDAPLPHDRPEFPAAWASGPATIPFPLFSL